MKKFIPKEKLGKKARKQLDSEQRTTWSLSPVTKKVESKKLYNRKRKAHDRYTRDEPDLSTIRNRPE